jgi:cytochrome P450
MAWLLYELAKHPKDQQALREEIVQSRRSLSEKGQCEFSVEDLDELSLLNAYIKVCSCLSSTVALGIDTP